MSYSPYHQPSREDSIVHSLKSDFFFDEKTILSLDAQSKEQAKGHLILLGSNVENFLKLATLIDGSSVDFLFGVRYGNQSNTDGVGRSKSNEVKKFIRSLDVTGQKSIAEFYFSLYHAITEYYEAQSSCCSFMCQESNKRKMFEKIERAFDTFHRRIRQQLK